MKQIIVLGLFLALLTTSAFAQKTAISQNQLVAKVTDGAYKAVYPDGQVKETGQYVAGKKEGKWEIFNRKGQLEIEVNYVKGLKEGILTAHNYADNGDVGSTEKYTYVNDILQKEIMPEGTVSGYINDYDGKDISAIAEAVKEMPEFVGGMNELFIFLTKNISYPPEARTKGIEGTAFIKFVVTETGQITAAHLVRGVKGDDDGGINTEALRVVKSMPKWTPGKELDKPVKVQYVLPIKFKLR